MEQPAGAGLSLEQDFGGDEDAMYKSDAFRMSCMKVLPCSKRFVHDWTECPFAHPQEKARRRDPRVHNYTGIACPSMKKEGCCAFGDHCPYAHNVFEYWLHPTRYRTQLCNDGSNCKRKICFFAHSLDELRVPACKPFVSPEALAGAAASAAADAEAKRKAATVGSPLSAFAALSPSPQQRSPMDALRAAQAEAGARLSGASVAGPSSPSTTDESAAALGSSPADAAVQAALQQLSGAGFSSQEQQVIELVTSLLAQDKVSAEQAASILQQMLPADALSHLQAHLSTPRASRDLSDSGRLSDPGRTSDSRTEAGAVRTSGGFEAVPAVESPRMAVPQAFSLEQMAAMQAAQSMGVPFSGGVPLTSLEPRLSVDSMRSSFDTGAGATLPGATLPASRSNSGSSSSEEAAPQHGPAAATQQEQPQRLRPSTDAALRRMSAEEAVGSASEQQAALAAVQQQRYAAAVNVLLTKQHAQRDRAALAAALQQRRQLLQLQQAALMQQAAATNRASEDSSRMSFDQVGLGSRGPSLDMMGTPRGSLEATYPGSLMPSYSSQEAAEPLTPDPRVAMYRRNSGSFDRPGRFYSGQLSSVPEQFPMINAPAPLPWGGAGRFSLDSAADRLSEDMQCMSFEAAARAAPQPTANWAASSFFAPAGMAGAERRSLSLPPLPAVRTSAPSKNPGLEEREALDAAAAQQLLGGTALHRLQ